MNAEVLAPHGASSGSRESAADCLAQRRSVSAMHLASPGPTPAECQKILTIAARVPDHGALVPWRFILVEGGARHQLATRLGDACLAAADDEEDAQANARRTVQKLGLLFGQPPLVVIVVSRPDTTAKIPVVEQVLSAGAVCMNLMNGATAFGYASNWLTGWAAAHPLARPILGLAEGETVAGIIPIGTAAERSPERPRPDLSQIARAWVG